MSYYNLAVRAVELATRCNLSPIKAWKKAAEEEYPNSEESRKKSCPKCAFLGLCEDGKIMGISPGSYTRSVDNKRYALKALEILGTNKIYTSSELWEEVLKGEPDKKKVSNSQMEVVLALWLNGLIQK